ncbi:MAG TPA: DUF4180 domain-containing protein [Pseudonocardiaceae bacterium]|jgi:hypothetical protein|nr:DUF4180 domain-containing protein [Pseudonocardiaceae bacterium]
MDEVSERHGVRVLECAPHGTIVRDDRDAVDLISLAVSNKAKLIALPVDRLPAGFFSLRTRIAGEIVQKFVQYRIPVAIIGDIDEHLAASEALRAFVREINRGKDIWFVADHIELDDRLRAQQNPRRPEDHLGTVEA